MAPTRTYTITFHHDRIGKYSGAEPLVVHIDAAEHAVAVAAHLVIAIRDHARRYLFSWGFLIHLDLPAGRGSITRGGAEIATFDVTSQPTDAATGTPSAATTADITEVRLDDVQVQDAVRALADLREALQALSTARRVGALPAALEIVQAAHTRSASLVDRLLSAAELDAHPERRGAVR